MNCIVQGCLTFPFRKFLFQEGSKVTFSDNPCKFVLSSSTLEYHVSWVRNADCLGIPVTSHLNWITFQSSYITFLFFFLFFLPKLKAHQTRLAFIILIINLQTPQETFLGAWTQQFKADNLGCMCRRDEGEKGVSLYITFLILSFLSINKLGIISTSQNCCKN